MLLARRPSDELIHRVIYGQRDAAPDYGHVGGTRYSEIPAGFTVNRSRAVIGAGEEAFLEARILLERLRALDLAWATVYPRGTEVRPGVDVGVLAKVAGVWALNVGRIVYVLEEQGEAPTYGFAFGTLPSSSLRGEERFTVTFDRRTGSVTYEIFSFARPRGLIPLMATPLLQATRRRFCRDSTEAMKNLVEV